MGHVIENEVQLLAGGGHVGAFLSDGPPQARGLEVFFGEGTMHDVLKVEEGNLCGNPQHRQAELLCGVHQSHRHRGVRFAQTESQCSDFGVQQPFNVACPDPRVVEVECHARGHDQGARTEIGSRINGFGRNGRRDPSFELGMGARRSQLKPQQGIGDEVGDAHDTHPSRPVQSAQDLDQGFIAFVMLTTGERS